MVYKLFLLERKSLQEHWVNLVIVNSQFVVNTVNVNAVGYSSYIYYIKNKNTVPCRERLKVS